MTEPMAVIRKTIGSSHQPYGASAQKTSSTTVVATPEPTSEPITDHAAISPATQVPATMPRPKDEQEDRHGPLPQHRHVGDDRRDVGVDGEEAAEADGAGGHREPDLAVAEEGRGLAATGRLPVARHRRHEREHHEDRGHRAPAPR